MNLLARREHAETELCRKLRTKKFSESDIRLAVDQLIQEGLLSNTRFIENYIHFRCNKGYGPMRIRAELIARGIAEELIEQNLNIADNAWFVNVRKVWQKRFKNQLPRDFKTRGQQIRFLQYRGFTQEQIESVLICEN